MLKFMKSVVYKEVTFRRGDVLPDAWLEDAEVKVMKHNGVLAEATPPDSKAGKKVQLVTE